MSTYLESKGMVYWSWGKDEPFLILKIYLEGQNARV